MMHMVIMELAALRQSFLTNRQKALHKLIGVGRAGCLARAKWPPAEGPGGV